MPYKKNKYQIFVERYLKDPNSLGKSGWRREVAIARKLFNKFQDDNFFTSLKLDFKLNSLAWFLTEKGLKFLYKQQSLFRLALPEKKGYTPKLEDKILGPKEKTKSKPKTIIDFIDKKDEKEDKK
jgi:hypothetical protein